MSKSISPLTAYHRAIEPKLDVLLQWKRDAKQVITANHPIPHIGKIIQNHFIKKFQTPKALYNALEKAMDDEDYISFELLCSSELFCDIPLIDDEVNDFSLRSLLLKAMLKNKYGCALKIAKYFIDNIQQAEKIPAQKNEELLNTYLICAAISENFEMFETILGTNFQIDENLLSAALQLLSLNNKSISTFFMYPKIRNSLSQENVCVLLKINILNKSYHTVKKITSFYENLPIDSVLNALYLNCNQPDAADVMPYMKSGYIDRIKTAIQAYEVFIEDASEQTLKDEFRIAVAEKNIWKIEIIRRSKKSFLIDHLELAQALIHIASIPSNYVHTSTFLFNYFVTILKYPNARNLTFGENGVGDALVQASKNGYDNIVRMIFTLLKAKQIPKDEHGFGEAIRNAKEYNHSKIVGLLEEYTRHLN